MTIPMNTRRAMGCMESGLSCSVKKKEARNRASRFDCFACALEREHEDAVAALEIELRVAAGGYGDVLLAVDGIRHRRRIDAGAAIVLPQLVAVLRIERLEPAVALAVEHEPPCRSQHAADQRLGRLHAPGNLAGVEVDRDQTPPLLLARDRLERAAQPQLAARIRRRLDLVGHRLMQV